MAVTTPVISVGKAATTILLTDTPYCPSIRDHHALDHYWIHHLGGLRGVRHLRCPNALQPAARVACRPRQKCQRRHAMRGRLALECVRRYRLLPRGPARGGTVGVHNDLQQHLAARAVVRHCRREFRHAILPRDLRLLPLHDAHLVCSRTQKKSQNSLPLSQPSSRCMSRCCCVCALQDLFLALDNLIPCRLHYVYV